VRGILFKPDIWMAKERVLDEYGIAVTRRVIKPQPPARFIDKRPDMRRGVLVFVGDSPDDVYEVHPRYDFGEIIYIKEAWWRDQSGGCWGYKLDDIEWPPSNCGGKAISPLFMPAWAARYFIEITDVRAERLELPLSPEELTLEGGEPALVMLEKINGLWVWRYEFRLIREGVMSQKERDRNRYLDFIEIMTTGGV